MDLGVKEEAGAAIGVLPTMVFGDRCGGEGRKQAAAELGRVQQWSQGRKGEAESGRKQQRNEGGGGGRFG